MDIVTKNPISLSDFFATVAEQPATNIAMGRDSERSVISNVAATPANPAASTRGAADADVDARLNEILGSLEDDKAEEIVTIDLRGKSSIADYMVVASGRSNRHVSAISEKLIERLKHDSGATPRAEGVRSGDWALIDASDVIVHIFRPEVREFYALEKMWGPVSQEAGPAPA